LFPGVTAGGYLWEQPASRPASQREGATPPERINAASSEQVNPVESTDKETPLALQAGRQTDKHSTARHGTAQLPRQPAPHCIARQCHSLSLNEHTHDMLHTAPDLTKRSELAHTHAWHGIYRIDRMTDNNNHCIRGEQILKQQSTGQQPTTECRDAERCRAQPKSEPRL